MNKIDNINSNYNNTKIIIVTIIMMMIIILVILIIIIIGTQNYPSVHLQTIYSHCR